MNKFIKITAIAVPAIMALAVAAPSEAKILLLGEGGWEVSFDGSVNGFYSFQTTDELTATDSSTNATHTGEDTDGEDTARITTGLLPAVWGMNVKAPTTNGLDMAARIGLYPQIENNRRKNNLGASGAQAGAQIDMREIFLTVDGSFGQILVGRTLSIYQGKNILTDMTLFGVGAVAGAGSQNARIKRPAYDNTDILVATEGQQFAQSDGLTQAVRPAELDRHMVGGEFTKPLAAAAAGRDQGRARADYADFRNGALTGQHHGGNGGSLGAAALGISRVLHVAAGVNPAVGAADRRAHGKFRIGRVGLLHGAPGRREKRVVHITAPSHRVRRWPWGRSPCR